MAQYTTEGEQYIAEKAGTDGAFKVTHFVLANIVGLDHTQQPPSDEQMPAAENIVDEQPVSQKGYLNANQTVYSLVLDSTMGDYEFNWIGLKTDDGRLLSVTYDAPQQKSRYDGAQEGNNITRNFVIEFEGAKDAAGITVTAETWQIDFTARLNQIDENQRLVGRDMFGRSTFFGSGFNVVRVGKDHVIKAGIGYIEGIRLFLLSDINLSTVADKSIWIDAAIVNDGGLATGKVVSVIGSKSGVKSDYVSTEQHYLIKVAEVDYNGAVIDQRNVMQESINSGGVTQGLKVFAENEVAALSAIVSEMFAGQVSTFPGTKIPMGWHKANGQTISRTDYQYLWNYANASGNMAASEGVKKSGQFGPGNGVSTFTLPDLRGQHLRYWDDGRGVDDGRVIASEQNDDIKQHNHTASSGSSGSHGHSASSASAGSHSHTTAGKSSGNNSSNVHPGSNLLFGSIENMRYSPAATSSNSGSHSHSVSVNSGGAHSHSVSVANRGIAENRVKNIALMVCIKY
jgi:microcystin-dependent protein